MRNFSTEQYSSIVKEIRERILSAEIFSNEKNVVFIESASLQIRIILELIAYLSVLVNQDKLNHEDRNQYHARKIVETLSEKTTVFYPLPSHMIHPQNDGDQPTLIPRGYDCALSLSDFKNTYQSCGQVLHAQHPLKGKLNIENIFAKNKDVLQRIKRLLQNHTIGIMHEPNKYTFLYVEIDFSNNENTKPSFIREYKTNIFDETQLMEFFNHNVS